MLRGRVETCFAVIRTNPDAPDGRLVRTNLNKQPIASSPLLAGAFVVCWTPGLLVLLLDGLNCTQCGVQHVKRWFLLLALLNSVMNPIIYSYKDEDMYSTMRKMICCLSPEKNPERPSRIPSTILSRSDTGSQDAGDGVSHSAVRSDGHP